MNQAAIGSDTSLDSELATDSSKDSRLVATRAYRAPLPGSMGTMTVEVGSEIEQLVFEIRARPKQLAIQHSRLIVPISRSTNG